MNKQAVATPAQGAEDVANEKKPKSLFRQMVEDKKVVSDYIRGKASISDVHAKGIKFVSTIWFSIPR